MKSKRMGISKVHIREVVIGGLAGLIVGVGAVIYNAANEYFNAPISYDSDGSLLYTQMISDTMNNKEGYRKAKFGSSVNHCGGFNSEEEMNTYPKDFESTLQADLCKRIVEIPYEETIKKGLENVTKYVESDGTKVSSYHGSGMEYWLEIRAFDRDEIKELELYAIDPITKENVRQIRKITGGITSGNFKWGKYMADINLDFDEKDVGNAELLRLDITDKKDNKYHSFIELRKKGNS